jgi:hypothetical protein
VETDRRRNSSALGTQDPSNGPFRIATEAFSGGCQLGDRLFYNFAYSSIGANGGAPIPAGGIRVTAYNVGMFPGFEFQVYLFAGLLQTVNSLLQFDVLVLPGGQPISEMYASMAGNAYSEDGTVDVGVTIIGAFTNSLALYDYSGGVLTSGTLFVNPPTMGPIHVVTDILVMGNHGVAVVDEVQNRFSETPVPEPASLLPLGTGLVGAARAWRKRKA